VIKVAIIGTGGIARKHAEALGTIPEARIVAVTDVVPEKAEAFAAELGADVHADPQASVERADLVYVLTPPSSHRELSVMALQAGKHVVCEKPLAISLEDGQAMVEAAKNAGVLLMVAFNMRFKKGFRCLKETLDSGQLGEIYHFWSHRMGIGVGEGYNWRTDPLLLCGMTIESLSHDIDLMRWLVGNPRDVKGTVHEARSDLKGFDTDTSAVFSLRSGGTALIHASWSSPLAMNSRGLLGTKGAAMSEGPGLWESRNLHLKTDEMEYESITVLNDPLDVNSYIAENRHFIDCVENKRPPEVTGEDGLRALEISHAILRSHREQRVVELN
jgi:predicted dehydrogenase